MTLLSRFHVPTARRGLALALAALVGCLDATAPRVPVGKVSVSSQSATVTVDATLQLSAAVLSTSGALLEDRSVTWQSSDPTTATVSASGIVRGLRTGSVRITATSGGESGFLDLEVVLPFCFNHSVPTGGAIAVAQQRLGNLTAASCVFYGYVSAVGHPLTVTSETSLQIDLVTQGYTPALFVTSPTRGILKEGFTWNPTTATVRITLAPGDYVVWAATPGKVASPGPYSLRTTLAAGACGAPTGGTLLPGDEAHPVITLDSCVLLDGPVAAGYTLNLAAPTRLSIIGSAATFPPMLALINDQQDIFEFTLGTTGSAAELSLIVPAGSHELWIGTYSGGNGTMSLSLGELPPCPAPTPLAVGDTVHGTLDVLDCGYRGGGGPRNEAWRVTLGAPARLRVDLISTAFDPFVVLTDTLGAIYGFNDDGGVGLNSLLVLNLPAGTFDIWAGGYGITDLGAYQLSTRELLTDVANADASSSAVSALQGPPKSPAVPWPPARTAGTRRREWPPTPSYRR